MALTAIKAPRKTTGSKEPIGSKKINLRLPLSKSAALAFKAKRKAPKAASQGKTKRRAKSGSKF